MAGALAVMIPPSSTLFTSSKNPCKCFNCENTFQDRDDRFSSLTAADTRVLRSLTTTHSANIGGDPCKPNCTCSDCTNPNQPAKFIDQYDRFRPVRTANGDRFKTKQIYLIYSDNDQLTACVFDLVTRTIPPSSRSPTRTLESPRCFAEKFQCDELIPLSQQRQQMFKLQHEISHLDSIFSLHPFWLIIVDYLLYVTSETLSNAQQTLTERVQEHQGAQKKHPLQAVAATYNGKLDAQAQAKGLI